jgi:hypothetical protein
VAKERREDFTLTLMNYAAERFLYRLSRSKHRDRFVVKGAMLFAVRIGERYRPTRDLDLLGLGEATEAAVNAAIQEIVSTPVDDDGLVFDMGTLTVHPIREDNRYGGLRAVMQARLTEESRADQELGRNVQRAQNGGRHSGSRGGAFRRQETACWRVGRFAQRGERKPRDADASVDRGVDRRAVR